MSILIESIFYAFGAFKNYLTLRFNAIDRVKRWMIIFITSIWANTYVFGTMVQGWLTLCTKRLFGFRITVLSDVIGGTLMYYRRVRCSIRGFGKTQSYLRLCGYCEYARQRKIVYEWIRCSLNWLSKTRRETKGKNTHINRDIICKIVYGVENVVKSEHLGEICSRLLTAYCGNCKPFCIQSTTFDTGHDQLNGSRSRLTAFPAISSNESGKYTSL